MQLKNKIYHYCASRGQSCGINLFAQKIDNIHENIIPIGGDIKYSNINPSEKDTILVEYEYGLHKSTDFDWIMRKKCQKVLIMHALSVTEAYNQVNKIIFSKFNKIIFLSNKAMQKVKDNPVWKRGNKLRFIPHYTEVLQFKPKEYNEGKIKLGIHGFAFPRNGFFRLLHWLNNTNVTHPGNPIEKVYIMSSINSFNKVAEYETSMYIDQMRRTTWNYNMEDTIEIDMNYYDTKKEIISKLYEKCNMLVHLTKPAPMYYNASGSINTLLATGLPTFAKKSIFTEDLPEKCIIPIKSLNEILNKHIVNDRWSPTVVERYHSGNNPEKFTKKMINFIDE